MKTAVVKIVPVLVSCLIISISYGQTTWKLTKNKDGIKVFQRDAQGSNFKNIRVECTLEGSFDKLIAIINNVSHYKDWVYNNKATTLLKRVDGHEFYYYSETFLPWPLDNRDAVMHTSITRDSLNRFLKIRSVAVPGYVAQKGDRVRIKSSNINWHVTRASSTAIRIIYTFETDPGGSVPSWLVNSFADKGPYESFKKLGALLKK